MSDLISRQAAIDSIEKHLRFGDELYPLTETDKILNHAFEIAASCVYNLQSAQPEIVRCCKCGFWDRDTLRYQFNDFRGWNEAECKILAERDPYNEINRYTEADDFCSYAERRTE